MIARPILFGGPTVRAILDGRKTVTRRVVALRTSKRCPYGAPGGRLWVREAWAVAPELDDYSPSHLASLPDLSRVVCYRADGENILGADLGRWRSSIHMPWWASRLDLEVVDVRPERLHDITDEDALAEGVDWGETTPAPGGPCAPAEAFARLWDEINGKRPGCAWRDDPWVWRVAFRRVGRGGV